jgi:hypothetical protein
MSPQEKRIHRALISLVFSLINWLLVDLFLVELPFWKYFIIELFLVISMKFYIFTTRKMNL